MPTPHIRTILVLSVAALLTACKVEKTGPDTYVVKTPSQEEVNRTATTATTNAAEAGRDIKEKAKEVANSDQAAKVREEGRELGKDISEAGRTAAKATGAALERARKKMQEHAKPGNQP